MPKPTIFLDIDGVINATGKRQESYRHWKHWEERDVADSRGNEWPIRMSLEVRDFLVDLHAQDRATILWHTTWQGDAQNVADAFGLPRFEVAEAPEFKLYKHGTAQGWWKMPAVLRHLESTDGRTIWIDDDLDAWFDDSRLAAFEGRLLSVFPARRLGLEQRHLDAITAFLDEGDA